MLKRICTITSKEFLISALEQELRKKFDAVLPTEHPSERMRRLLAFRNIHVLYNDVCDLCGKNILSIWGKDPKFPVYCPECWNSDKWEAPSLEVNFERPFFEQFEELFNKTPHLSRLLVSPVVNSDYSNNATNVKNSYWSFAFFNSEDCYYVMSCDKLLNSTDVLFTDDAEFIYESISCHKSYQVFWSQFAIGCTESYFLYDCIDCTNCALSTGLRHKEYVFMNEQLTKEEYEKKIVELRSGSALKIHEFSKKFEALKKVYPKKYMVGTQNENVSGNFCFQSKNVENGFRITSVEDSVNVFDVRGASDLLDVAAYGANLEEAYSCTTCGTNASNLQYGVSCFNSVSNLTYCIWLVQSNNCFGSTCTRGLEFAILNKQYSQEEYEEKKALLIKKMKERGEWGKMFTPKIMPFAYNESMAQVVMPLTKQGAEARGFRWAAITFPEVDKKSVLSVPDNIHDISWKDVEGKIIICEESKRPFRIIRQEFEFYKKFDLPLPRLHPNVRLQHRYPNELMFALRESKCSQCETFVLTSMTSSDKLLCEQCYQDQIQ
jgi:hypothetical protein